MASELDVSMRGVVALAGDVDRLGMPDLLRDFIEKITYAEPEEILSSLRGVLSDDWMAMPVWARNLAYRLACLQRPDDYRLLREAAADLLCFGPDWDNVAEELKARAAQLEAGLDSSGAT